MYKHFPYLFANRLSKNFSNTFVTVISFTKIQLLKLVNNFYLVNPMLKNFVTDCFIALRLLSITIQRYNN